MKRKNVFLLAAVVIVWLMISLIVLTGSMHKGPVFYISYAFITLAFIVQILTLFIMDREKNENLKILGFPLAVINLIYMAVALVLGLLFMFFWLASLRTVLLSQGLLFCAYLVLLFVFLSGREQVRSDISNVSAQAVSMRDMASRAEYLYTTQSNYQKKVILKELYEALRYSDPVSRSADTTARDAEISDRIRSLEMNSERLDIEELKNEVDTTVELVKKRNM